MNFNPASTVTNVGDLAISGGTLNFSSGDTITVPSYTQSSGTLTGSDPLIVSGATIWSGGTMTGSGQTTANGLVTFSGGLPDTRRPHAERQRRGQPDQRPVVREQTGG